jgi:translocation and assembly module TamB
MRRALHLGWILLAAVVLAALGAIYCAGWTESGLRLLTTRLSGRVGPVTMSIQGARGTLAGGLHIDSFTLDHRRVHVEARDISARIAMAALLRMTVRIEDGHVGDSLTRVITPPDDNSIWVPHFLREPLIIEIPGAQVDRSALIATNGRRWDFTALRATVNILPYTIEIRQSVGDYSGIAIDATGEVLAARPIGIRAQLHFVTQPEGQPKYLAAATLDGDLDRLAINGGFSAPFVADFSGAALTLNRDWHWEGKSHVRRLDLMAWGAGNALGVITGQLQLSGDREGFHARGELTPPGLAAGPLRTELDGNYSERVLSASNLRFIHRPSGTTLAASGTIGIVGKGPRLALHGTWSTLRWPLADAAAPIHSTAGNWTLDGLWPYALTAAGDLRVKDLPPMSFNGRGTLAHDHLAVESARVLAYDGEAQLTGTAAWAPHEQWQLAGTMRNFNIERARPGVNGRLNFHIAASGEGFDKRGTLRSEFDQLSGAVRGQRATGHARAELAGDDWLLSDVRLQLGTSRINLDGRVGNHIDLRFDVDTDDLALLKAGAQGRLRAKGTVSGDPATPVLQLEARGSNIAWDELRAQTLSADVQLDAAHGTRADASIRVGRLQYGERTADSLSFVSSGTLAAHTATLEMTAPQLQLHATGDGQFRDGVWQWRVQQLRAADGRDLLLNLEAPALIELAQDHQRLERLCLKGAQVRVCSDATRSGGASSANVMAENMPLQSLTAGLVARTEFDGTLSVDAHVSSPGAAAPWQGSLQSQLVNAAVRHRFDSNRVDTFNLGTGKVELRLADSHLTGIVALDAGAAGSIKSNIAASATAGPWRDWPLEGALLLDSDAFDVLASYLREIDRASGRVKAMLRLAGTLGSPQLNGELNVTGARIDAYQTNMALRDLNLDAEINDNVLSLSGSVNAGVDGKASIRGHMRLQGGQLYGDMHFTGENLLLVNIFEAKVYASPNLDFRIAAKRIDVTGTVDLPYAKLEQPEELASAVRASSDEVVVNRKAPEARDPFKIYSNITVRLGERVTINTSGLQGRLSGTLTATSDESGIARGNGELGIDEGGKYTAYGRKLDITRGRLLFDNSALGDPAVDLRAQKKFPDITVGVNVRGTLGAPRMTFFSDPVVSQQQIVSVLLAGGSLESIQAGASSNANSNEARANALLQGSAILAQQLGNRSGVDVSVEQNLQNDTSLVLGRYLSPRLYLSYGYSIVEAINTIKLNYSVADHWGIRTEAGKYRSADLVYTIER